MAQAMSRNEVSRMARCAASRVTKTIDSPATRSTTCRSDARLSQLQAPDRWAAALPFQRMAARYCLRQTRNLRLRLRGLRPHPGKWAAKGAPPGDLWWVSSVAPIARMRGIWLTWIARHLLAHQAEIPSYLKARRWEELAALGEFAKKDAPEELIPTDPALYQTLRQQITRFRLTGWSYLSLNRLRELAASQEVPAPTAVAGR